MSWGIYLGESENFVWYQLQACPVDLSRAVKVFGFYLLKECVIDPQVNVPLPVPLLICRRNIADCPFIHIPDLKTAAIHLQLSGQLGMDMPAWHLLYMRAHAIIVL